MAKRIAFFLYYGLFWLLFFLFLRLYFILNNLSFTDGISFTQIIQTFTHGIIMDLSSTGYLLLIPGLAILVSFFLNKRWILVFINIYTLIFLFIVSFLAVSDAVLYKFWGFRLDSTPLLYLRTPKEAMASVSVGLIIGQITIALLIFGFAFFMYRKCFKRLEKFDNTRIIYSPVMLLAIALLIIPIRGGFGIAPMNVGKVYFSHIQFLNHASINLFWNVGFSIVENQGVKNTYHYFDDEEMARYDKIIRSKDLPSDSIILSTSRPNIVLIIFESLTAKVIEPLGGLKDITPEFTKLTREGLLFTNFYATGDRSDKGLVGILSGYPAQTNTSIIKYASKTRTLPRLALSLQQNGYFTAFYYGGDIDFANMRSYLLDSKYNQIVSMDSFPKSTYNSKWGTHDHFVFQKLNNNLQHTPQPFFATFFTLSSHEPFEVPMKYIKGKDDVSLYLNSVHYTDSCLGDFVAKAKKQSWWKNTLMIVVADHGHRFPGNSENNSVEKFRIPMLWLGGALKAKGTMPKFATQTEIPATVLSQLGIASNDYQYSKNIFGRQPLFGYYAYKGGFGILNDSTTVIYDCVGNKASFEKGKAAKELENIGKAYTQDINTDLEKR
ncbi:MAG TPA: sulfatase-like hydrolase/transferase [Bacteroidales bacterium]|nr:sulfatase-like hydrolase/transferase [Bacteroidales bacterium]